ncbi:hypothetical protein SporoP37_12245 [Sporosarcina sp. P37]|uniref:ABC transporter permease n=1 Tax=unclassified Sporosarcina TaxID=2647733 RepID=UPI000A179F82|nr:MULTISPECIES: ABC transporter permease [unclassified Sporosarcina]ARK25349.1 hypothetical protein SporoP37_12245 [Sporosarcina sp. P37]
MKASTISKNKSLSIQVASCLALLALWYVLSTQYPSILIPSPFETFKAMVHLAVTGELLEQFFLSMTRMISGFAIGMLAGVGVGLIGGRFQTGYEAMKPVISFLLGIPPIILVVIAMVWFGTSPLIPISVVAILAFPTFYLHTANGCRSIDTQLLEMASIYRKTPFEVLKHIILPGLAIPLFTAVSLASGGAVRVTIMAELLGTSSGMGSAISLARININTDIVFAWTLISVLTILLIDYSVIHPLKRFVMKWDQKEEAS